MNYVKKFEEYLKINERVDEKTYKWYSKQIVADLISKGLIITKEEFHTIKHMYVLNLKITTPNYSIDDKKTIDSLFLRIVKIGNAWKKKLVEYGVYLALRIIPQVEYLNVEFIFKDIFIERVKPPQYVYHITNKKIAIEEQGLVPQDSKRKWGAEMEYPPVIFAAIGDDPREWFNYNDDKFVWRIDTTLIQNKWWRDLNCHLIALGWIMTFDSIPPAALHLMSKDEIYKQSPV